MRAIHYPFQFGPRGEIMECISYDDIVRGQVIDALMTNLGERVFRPRYGCDIQSALFDPQDDLVRMDAAAFIKTKLAGLVTRATVRSVSIDVNEPAVVKIMVVYRSTPYSTDATLIVPVSSEFIRRQLEGVLNV